MIIPISIHIEQIPIPISMIHIPVNYLLWMFDRFWGYLGVLGVFEGSRSKIIGHGHGLGHIHVDFVCLRNVTINWGNSVVGCLC